MLDVPDVIVVLHGGTLLSILVFYWRRIIELLRADRRTIGLDDDTHLYGCLQSLFKFHPEFDALMDGILEQDPKDSFSRYALALEYIKSGQTDDARREFELVRDQDPGYVATYFQLAQLYRTLGLRHEAEKTYRTGITVAAKAGDSHTKEELEGALEGLLMES
mgnify:CR=1 FL=1